MKPFKLLVSLVIVSSVLGFQQCTNNTNTKKGVEKQDIKSTVDNDSPKVRGTLQLENEKLQLDLEILADNRKFQFADSDNYIVLDENNSRLKSIVLRYHSKSRADTCDFDIEEENTIPVTFKIDLPRNWNEGDQVRVMLANENTSDEFNEMKSYFIGRLKKFQYRLGTSRDYTNFTKQWNANPNNRFKIDPICTKEYDIDIPRSAGNGGVITIQ